MIKKINIKKNEIGLLFKNGDIHAVLTAGKYHFCSLFNEYSVNVFDLSNPTIDKKISDMLINFHTDIIEKYCHHIVLSENEIALRYQNNKLVEVLLPDTNTLFWKGYLTQEFVISTLDEGFRVCDDVAEILFKAKQAKLNIKGLEQLAIDYITRDQIGILWVDCQIHSLIASEKILVTCAYQHQVGFSRLSLTEECAIPEKLARSLLDTIPESIQEHGILMETNHHQVGIRYEQGVIKEIVAPNSKKLYWKSSLQHSLVKIDLADDFQVPAEITQQLLQPDLKQQQLIGGDSILLTPIAAHFMGILHIDGKVVNLLSAGTHAYWRFNRDISIHVVDTRLQDLEVSGQEILTKDKVNLRINLIASWRYQDVLLAFKSLTEPVVHLYRELQFGLRQAVGTHTLDELLENKNIINDIVNEHVQGKINSYGIEISSLGVKDIILPGDMKTILAQVVEAEKSSQANVIRRREETAATRSLLNTAKVMENNPVALRLKELETLERIAERIDSISVVGGLDQVLNGLVHIKPNALN